MADELAAEARTVRKLRARQERQRTSARVVALAPVVLLLLLRQVNPDYLDPYDSLAGQAFWGLPPC
jgi:Flp pilus assembly protein TadB